MADNEGKRRRQRTITITTTDESEKSWRVTSPPPSSRALFSSEPILIPETRVKQYSGFEFSL
ncbi:hypothetical protein E2C01_060147 [Portunus trituberculatus]|uniref:Uncharacterized protein n=1 Tax=Portunus trituberculatus TaxID=210409 RepID=A0A5B7HB81_PORTR|nr:hypothetical protein [Portunus trituberculatus]